MSEFIKMQPLQTPIGELVIGVHEDEICLCDWKWRKKRAQIDLRIQKGLNATFIHEEHDLHKECQFQLDEYFERKRNKFDLPIKMVGSAFQKQVWEELQKIEFGTTISYLELSKRLENEKAIRAVASANGANAIAIIIPCHRVIGQDGALTGYAGGLSAKKKLLLTEGIRLSNQLELF